MNSYFIDTSSLFKRYIYEPGTEKLDSLMGKKAFFYISNLTIVEIVSNLKRKKDITKEIDKSIYLNIKREFFNDISRGILRMVDFASDIIINSINILDLDYVTPTDSIQLSSALYLKNEIGTIFFVCSDKKLGILAQKKGLETIII
jgi:predicted nucleic acid-binding protein